MKSALLNAVLFVPCAGPAAARWLKVCGEFADRKGYKVVSIVKAWDDVVRMVHAGQATIVVVGRRDHLPENRMPRMEVVTETEPQLPPEQRRPVRRSADR